MDFETINKKHWFAKGKHPNCKVLHAIDKKSLRTICREYHSSALERLCVVIDSDNVNLICKGCSKSILT